MSDRKSEGTDPTDDASIADASTVSDAVSTPILDQYKILAEFIAASGAALMAQNNASSGTPIGVYGATPNANGLGFCTPDDARVEGIFEAIVAVITGDLYLQNNGTIKDGQANDHLKANEGGPLGAHENIDANDNSIVSVDFISGTDGDSVEFPGASTSGTEFTIEARTSQGDTVDDKNLNIWAVESESHDHANIDISAGSNNGVVKLTAGDHIQVDTIRTNIVRLPSGEGTTVGWDSSGDLVALTSSARYKTNIEPMSTDTTAVLDLEPRSFEYEDTGQEGVGLIAEEVEDVLPELVTYDEEGRPESVQYDRLGVFLAPEVRKNRDRLDGHGDRLGDLREAVERKDDRIEDLERENDRKDDRIDELERRLATLEAQVGTVDAPADD